MRVTYYCTTRVLVSFFLFSGPKVIAFARGACIVSVAGVSGAGVRASLRTMDACAQTVFSVSLHQYINKPFGARVYHTEACRGYLIARSSWWIVLFGGEVGVACTHLRKVPIQTASEVNPDRWYETCNTYLEAEYSSGKDCSQCGGGCTSAHVMV